MMPLHVFTLDGFVIIEVPVDVLVGFVAGGVFGAVMAGLVMHRRLVIRDHQKSVEAEVQRTIELLLSAYDDVSLEVS